MKGGGIKSYRFNDQFDIERLPSQTNKTKKKRKRASDQQQEEKTQEERGGRRGGGNITNFQFKVLPADSPSPRLHKTGLEENRDGEVGDDDVGGGRGGEGGVNDKEPKKTKTKQTVVHSP